ncbi:hypothetical protein [Salirhabdus salicampi]|nr:hypothetical protein [Salirhabdus salicampi]
MGQLGNHFIDNEYVLAIVHFSIVLLLTERDALFNNLMMNPNEPL